MWSSLWSRLVASFSRPLKQSNPFRQRQTRPSDRRRARSTRSGRPLYKSPGIEFLEPRQPAYSWGFDATYGALWFGLDGDDGLSVYADSQYGDRNYYASGTSGEVLASDVRSLTIYMADEANLDLTGIDPTYFFNLNNISIVSNGFQVTINGAQMGEFIDASAGYGTTVLNVNDNANHVLDGGPGSVIVNINGGSGTVTLYGGSGYNEIYASGGGSGSYTLDGGSGTDVIDVENVFGATFTLNGGSGSDTIYNAGSGDVLNGGTGSETLYGSGTLNDHGGFNDVYGGVLNANGGSNNVVHGTGTLSTTAGVSIVGNGTGYNVTNNGGSATLNIDSDAFNSETLSVGSDRFIGANGPITTGSAGDLGITKSGTGSAMLAGPNLYNGDTTINAGTLVVNSDASLGDTAIRVQGGTFAPHPDVGVGTITAGELGSGAGVGASLWLSGTGYDMTDGAIGQFQLNQQSDFSGPSLTLENSTLNFDINNTASDELATSGSAAIGGVNTIGLVPIGNTLTVGAAYNLITADGGGLSDLGGSFVFANGMNAEVLSMGGHSYTLLLAATDTEVTAKVVAVDRGLDYWIGCSGNNSWNGANWSSASGGAANKTFANGDIVVFDSASQSRSISIDSPVAPLAMIFKNDASHSYTITGSGSNVITGSGTATILGGGMATLVGQHIFTGVTQIDAGTLQLGSSAGIGSVGGNIVDNAMLSFANPTAQTFSQRINGSGQLKTTTTSTLTLSGVSTYSGPTIVGQNTALAAGAPNAFSPNSSYAVSGTLDLAGNAESIGSLSGEGTVTSSATSTTSTLTVGSDGTSTIFAGTLRDGAGSGILALNVGGAALTTADGSIGTLILAGTNTFSGGTTVADGTLALGTDEAGNENANSLGSGPVTLSGGQLSLGGTSGSTVVSYSIPNAITLNGGSIYSSDGAQHLAGLLTIGDGGGTITTQFAGKDVFLDGGITGTGDLAIDNQTPDGTGSLGAVHFSGSAGYSGTITVSAPDSAANDDGGLIEIDSNAALQDATVEVDGANAIAFGNGITSPSIAALLGSGNINLTTLDNRPVNLLIGNDDADSLYAGVLSGPGGLTKIGGDTLTLTGVNTYTGPTDDLGGSIRLTDNDHQILDDLPSGSSGIVSMDLSDDFNLTGIVNDTDTFTGGFDGAGLAISASLEPTIAWSPDGTPPLRVIQFGLGPSESPDVVQALGQDLQLTAGQYSLLGILAAAVDGSRADQLFTVNYTDGSSTTFHQGISDWSTSGNFQEFHPIELPYADTSLGVESGQSTYHLFGYEFDVDSSKIVSSLTLPDNPNVRILAVSGIPLEYTATNLLATPAAPGTMHLSWTAPNDRFHTLAGYNVFRGRVAGGESATPLNARLLNGNATTFDDLAVAPGNEYYYTIQAVFSYPGYPDYWGPMSLEASGATATSGPLAQVDLSPSFNAVGIRSDGSTFSDGGIDGYRALSNTLLQGANLGYLLGRPDVNDVIKAGGETVDVPQGEYTQLHILGGSSYIGYAGQFTVNYTDGTSDTSTVYTLPWEWNNDPPPGSSTTIALEMPYANMSDGSSESLASLRLLDYAVNLNSTKTVQSVTLPDNPGIFIVGMNCVTANILPTASPVTLAPGAVLDLNGTNQAIASIAGDGGDVLLANSTLTVGNGDSTNFAGTFDGTGTLAKVGGGTLTLGGVNTYSGVTTVSDSGTLRAGVADAFSPYSAYPEGATGLDANSLPQLSAAAIDDFFATYSSAGEIDLSWSDPAAGYYQVEGRPSGTSTWNVLGKTTATTFAVSKIDANTDLSPSSAYDFRVEALNPFGNSAYSLADVCSTTSSSAQPDDGPTILGASAGGTITRTWTTLSASASGGVGPLSYSWSAISAPSGAPSPTIYWPTWANTGVTFQQAGDYTLKVVITDADGLSVSSSTTVTVQQTLSSLSIAPTSAALQTGGSRRFDALGIDQFGNPIDSPPNVTWSVQSGGAGGTIDSQTGVYTAPSQLDQLVNDTLKATATDAVGDAIVATTSVEITAFADPHGPYQVTAVTGPDVAPGHDGLISGTLSVSNSGWIDAGSPEDAVAQAVSGTIQRLYSYPGMPATANFPADLGKSDGFTIGAFSGGSEPSLQGPLVFNSGNGTYSGQIAMAHIPSDWDFFWDVTVKPTFDRLPTIGLQNGQADPNLNPGEVILVTDPTQPIADSDHRAEMDVSLSANTSNNQTPADLTGWTLTLSPSKLDPVGQIYDSSGHAKGQSETWTLDGTYEDEPLLDQVFVSESDPGEHTWQLVLADPSAKPQDSVTAVDTAGKPTLIAKKVNDSKAVDTFPNATTDLKHGDTAYVPVDNQDQNYVENKDANGNNLHTLIANKDQNDPIKNDWGLLPFTVHVPKALPGTFYLKFPDSIRVFKKNPDVDSANKISSEGSTDQTGIGPLLDGNGDGTFYIEGVKRDAAVQIDLDKQGVNKPLDTLKVNVFELIGPQYVPNYSTYTYTAKWAGAAPQAVNSRWSLSIATTSKLVKATGNDQGDVKFGAGPAPVRVFFAASPDYTWCYHVTIVDISLAHAQGGDFVAGSGGTIQRFRAFPYSPLTAADRTGVTSVSIAASNLRLVVNGQINAAVRWWTWVSMAGGGPKLEWGVDQMEIGFTQIGRLRHDVATYATATGPQTLVTSENLSTPFVDGEDNASQTYWYSTKTKAGNTVGAFIMKSSSTSRQPISADDTPQQTIPADYEQTRGSPVSLPANVSPIRQLRLLYGFDDYITAGVLDGSRRANDQPKPLDNIYTILAAAPPTAGALYSWTLDTTGTFDAGIEFNPSNSTLQLPANKTWSFSSEGKRVPPVAWRSNQVIADQYWYG